MPEEVPPGVAALATVVRRLRLAGKLSQQRLADRSGVGLTTIKEIENRKKNRGRRTGTLEALSTALGKDAGYLDDVLNQRVAADTAVGAEDKEISPRAVFDLLREIDTKLDAIVSLLRHDVHWPVGQAPDVDVTLEGHHPAPESPS